MTTILKKTLKPVGDLIDLIETKVGLQFNIKRAIITRLPVSSLNVFACVLQFRFDPNRPCKITRGGKSFP